MRKDTAVVVATRETYVSFVINVLIASRKVAEPTRALHYYSYYNVYKNASRLSVSSLTGALLHELSLSALGSAWENLHTAPLEHTVAGSKLLSSVSAALGHGHAEALREAANLRQFAAPCRACRLCLQWAAALCYHGHLTAPLPLLAP